MKNKLKLKQLKIKNNISNNKFNLLFKNTLFN